MKEWKRTRKLLYSNGLYRDYCKDPFLHSQLTKGSRGLQGLRGLLGFRGFGVKDGFIDQSFWFRADWPQGRNLFDFPYAFEIQASTGCICKYLTGVGFDLFLTSITRHPYIILIL